MSCLADSQIAAMCDSSTLIQPYSQEHLQPCSYDLSADKDFYLDPHEFKLLSTLEWVNLSNDLQGQIYGRSSIGRLGIFIHISAGFVDAGFRGNLTLECFNASKQLWHCKRGDRIAQIAFYKLGVPASFPYSGRYQNQQGVTESRL